MPATKTQLTIEDLVLCGTDQPFYLEPGEVVDYIRDNGDGTAVVRITSPNGFSGPVDAEIAS